MEVAISHVEVELSRRVELTGAERIEVQTAFQYAKTLVRFGDYANAVKGALVVGDLDQGLIEQFMWAIGLDGLLPPAATRSFRLTSVRSMVRFLLDRRCIDSDPTRGLTAGRRQEPRTSLRLSEEEFESVKAASLMTLAETRLPAVIAIAETGAVSTEIGEARVCDLDFENHRIWLSGCHTALPRWGHLSPWGEDQLRRRVVSLASSPTALLVSTGASRDIRQKSVHGALDACFTRAGVRRRRGVKAGSIRALAGWRAYLTLQRVEDAARLLGCTSLDAAAATIGLTWNRPDESG